MGDVFLEGVTDLFGDPVPVSRGKRGRPAHMPTAENRRFVQLALACGHDEDMIAKGLRITTRTLNRHYFHELEGKHSARLRLEMKNLGALVEQVDAGSVSAMSLLDRKIERLKQQETVKRHVQAEPRAVSAPVGKKEAAKAAAAGVTGKFAPPPAPIIH